MAAVSSTMQALGSSVPSFGLPDVARENSIVTTTDMNGRPLLIMFICNHCPFVVHILEEMVELANQAVAKGFGVSAISSNDQQAYPQDGPLAMAELASKHAFNFPYLFDESQEVAKAFGAACTPDFFVYDAQHRLQYRGQMDDSRPGNGRPVNGHDLSLAIENILAGKAAIDDQKPSIGCSIKWRSGNAPDYS